MSHELVNVKFHVIANSIGVRTFANQMAFPSAAVLMGESLYSICCSSFSFLTLHVYISNLPYQILYFHSGG
jgi:hypothetical protein